MLGRKCRFHDLAFFDPVIFESLRQLVIDAENKVRICPFHRCFISGASIVIGLTYHLRCSIGSICSPSPSGDMTGCCGPKVHSSVSICPFFPPSSIQKVTDYPLLFLWWIACTKFTFGACLATPLSDSNATLMYSFGHAKFCVGGAANGTPLSCETRRLTLTKMAAGPLHPHTA